MPAAPNSALPSGGKHVNGAAKRRGNSLLQLLLVGLIAAGLLKWMPKK